MEKAELENRCAGNKRSLCCFFVLFFFNDIFVRVSWNTCSEHIKCHWMNLLFSSIGSELPVLSESSVWSEFKVTEALGLFVVLSWPQPARGATDARMADRRAVLQGNSVKLGRGKSCFYKNIVLKSCGTWLFHGIVCDFCSCSSMSSLCNISVQFLLLRLSVAMLQAQDSRETLREKACSKMKAFVFPWVHRTACFLPAKGQAVPGQPLPGLNFLRFPFLSHSDPPGNIASHWGWSWCLCQLVCQWRRVFCSPSSRRTCLTPILSFLAGWHFLLRPSHTLSLCSA